MVIGKGGHVLKKVGMLARRDMEAKFQTKVFLKLYVTVEKDWRNNPKKMEQLSHSDE